MDNEKQLENKSLSQHDRFSARCFQEHLSDGYDQQCELKENITPKEHICGPDLGREKAASIQFSDYKILIVDDNKECLNILKIYLNTVGFNVVSAMDGAEGMYKFHSDFIDMVLTDLCMPEMSGNLLAQHIRKTRPTLPIIAITGSSFLAENHFDEVLIKPVELNVLLDSIKFHLLRH